MSDDPTRSASLESWCDARPLDRKVVGVRMAGRWVVALVDESGEPHVGAGRSLHDAVEAAQDAKDCATGSAGFPPPRPAGLVAFSLVEPVQVPEFCSCGRDWPWESGAYVGVQDDGTDKLELRNCPGCGSTRARVLPPTEREQAAYLHGPGSDEENRAAARESAR